MKEPLYDKLENKDCPICPYCGSYYGDTPDPMEEKYTINCWSCGEDYEVYPVTNYSTYPIESKEN